MKKLIFFMATLLSLAAVFAFTNLRNWKPTDKYNIKFSTDGAAGIFKTFTGNIVFDDKSLATAKFDVSIDVNSINTGNGLQNKHAKGADWFDAAKYPVIKYTSRKIVKAGTSYSVTGDLQMHGVTKEITIPFNFANAGSNGTFSGSFTVNRSDFKIGKPGGDVGEAIKIEVSVPVVKG
jgi:polyisoprenoid-binding protein YceI